jgi:hypothetical protein
LSLWYPATFHENSALSVIVLQKLAEVKASIAEIISNFGKIRKIGFPFMAQSARNLARDNLSRSRAALTLLPPETVITSIT